MPSSLHYTRFETTDLIVTAHILLPCSAAPPLSQPSSVCLDATGNRHTCFQKKSNLSPQTVFNLRLMWHKHGEMFLDIPMLHPFPLFAQTSYHFSPTSLRPPQFEAINWIGKTSSVQIKSRWDSERAHDVFGFRPESHVTERETHPHSELRSPTPVWTTTRYYIPTPATEAEDDRAAWSNLEPWTLNRTWSGLV